MILKYEIFLISIWQCHYKKVENCHYHPETLFILKSYHNLPCFQYSWQSIHHCFVNRIEAIICTFNHIFTIIYELIRLIFQGIKRGLISNFFKDKLILLLLPIVMYVWISMPYRNQSSLQFNSKYIWSSHYAKCNYLWFNSIAVCCLSHMLIIFIWNQIFLEILMHLIS